MTAKEKANYFIETYGRETAEKIIFEILNEIQKHWSQETIDFYLDIKLEIQNRTPKKQYLNT